MTKPPLILCLMGPTASGKTDLALFLAASLPCDIISVDSAMVYKGMDIGTAKPTSDILEQFPHQLIDILDPAQPYSAGQFCLDVVKEIDKTLARGRIPLLVGGTMLYFRSLQQGLSQLPQADSEIRRSLTEEAERFGWEALYRRLIDIDPVAASRIKLQDKQRIQRALEIYALTGKSPTDSYQLNQPMPSSYRFLNIALIPPNRQELHERISVRFKNMLKQGLVEEVEKLYLRDDLSPDMPSLRSVGYRQTWAYLASEMSLVEMEEKSIAATRQLAKRQFTWLRNWKEISTFDADRRELSREILSFIESFLS